MSFLPGAGYGGMFGYTGANVRADGFEVKHLAATIMRRAFGELVFTRFLNESTDAFGVGKGGTFTVPIFKDFGQPGTVSPLVSGTAIGVGTQQTDSVSMMMYEYGTGIAYERILAWFTSLEVQNQLIVTLGNHIGRMINWLDFNVMNQTIFGMEVPASGSYTTVGTSRNGINQGTYGEIGMGALALLYDTFRKSFVSPLTDRGMYGMVGNSETFRNLKQGSVFQNAFLYNSLQGIRYQVLGEFMNFVFVETEEQLTKGTAFAFGANVGGFGFGQLPNVTYYPDFGQDAGRLPVWKTIFYRGQDAIFRDKGTACIKIHANTSAFNYGGLG